MRAAVLPASRARHMPAGNYPGRLLTGRGRGRPAAAPRYRRWRCSSWTCGGRIPGGAPVAGPRCTAGRRRGRSRRSGGPSAARAPVPATAARRAKRSSPCGHGDPPGCSPRSPAAPAAGAGRRRGSRGSRAPAGPAARPGSPRRARAIRDGAEGAATCVAGRGWTAPHNRTGRRIPVIWRAKVPASHRRCPARARNAALLPASQRLSPEPLFILRPRSCIGTVAARVDPGGRERDAGRAAEADGAGPVAVGDGPGAGKPAAARTSASICLPTVAPLQAASKAGAAEPRCTRTPAQRAGRCSLAPPWGAPAISAACCRRAGGLRPAAPRGPRRAGLRAAPGGRPQIWPCSGMGPVLSLPVRVSRPARCGRAAARPPAGRRSGRRNGRASAGRRRRRSPGRRSPGCSRAGTG